MISPAAIYEKACNGDPLKDDELQSGVEHFGRLHIALAVAGPVFKLACNEAGRIERMFEGFIESRNEQKLEVDRRSASYKDGYKTGLNWNAPWQPGGPFVMKENSWESERAKAICQESQIKYRQWHLGFKEGSVKRERQSTKTPA